MERTSIPDNYSNIFPEDWEGYLGDYLSEKSGYQDSPFKLQNVRQAIKSGLEAEFLAQINRGLMPEMVVPSSRLADIYSFLVEKNVWPIYGMGCSHCVESVDPVAPFFPPDLIEGVVLLPNSFP